MSDDQVNQEKPKATLIKQKKLPTGDSSAALKQEKKKVVVVKKKMVVKRPVPKVVARSTEKTDEITEQKRESETRRVSEKPDEQRSTVRQPAERFTRNDNRGISKESRPSTFRRDRRDFRQDRPSRPPSGDYTSRPGQRGGVERSSRPRPAGERGFRPNRPSDQAGAPFTQGRRGAPPYNKPADVSKENKQTGKKIFKAKKRPVYPKKDEVQERDFQIKKKPIKKMNPVPKEIEIMEVIRVSELARKMNLKASELISRLMTMGMMVSINQQIDAETAQLIAVEYGSTIKIVSLYEETLIERDEDEAAELKARPPIVTIMGHVDHGKTKLLDSIRVTDVVSGEFGGITQHIGAYKVEFEKGDIVFLDTPGHEAFTLMRARGAQVTDIVVLVVAANDGVMPQTVEAINHAKAAKVPIIVAVNKIDLPDANIDRVKQQLSEYDLIPEDWGGNVLFNEISALKGIGINELLNNILLQAEILELKANYDCRAEGKVIESRVDHGRGIISTIIVQRGTLRIGDAFVAGIFPGKVRAMFNDKGSKIDIATPATPVEVLGFTGVPNSGDPFQVTENEKIARQVGMKRQELEKQGEMKNIKKITLDNLYEYIQDGDVQELKIIIKGDVHGSVEALQTALEKLSTSEIKLTVIHSAAGAIVESDVNLASAYNAIIIGFHVRPTPKASALADQEKVDIRKYNIIYSAVEDIKNAMEGLLTPDITEEVTGTIEVRELFKVPKIGVIAGSYVQRGRIRRSSNVRVFREGIQLYEGKINSLKRFKDDVREVEEGYECGIGIDKFSDFRTGDIIEVYELHEVAKKL